MRTAQRPDSPFNSRVRLADVVAPLSAATFVSSHWNRGVPFVAHPDPCLVETLKSIPALATPEALLAQHLGDVKLFGRDAFRSTVPASVALDFLSTGFNLYVTHVERTVPEARALLSDVARDLGLGPWQLRLEAFAGKAGGVSSRHYDHDVNLQILLDGNKEWVIEPNRNIANPSRPFHPTRDWRGASANFPEEAYAKDPDIPTSFDMLHAKKLRVSPGTVVFLPRGYWHEVTSLDDTWSINLVFVGITRAGSMCRMLEMILLQDPELREYCDGSVFNDRPHLAEQITRSHARFDQMRKRAMAVLGRMSPEDAALAGVETYRFKWRGQADQRCIVQDGDAWFLEVPGVLDGPLELDSAVLPALRSLCALRHAFDWAQALCAARMIGPVELWNLLAELVELNLLEQPSNHCGAFPRTASR